jgi:gamma-glutamyltranspeptidase/glutathione hydrolase
VVDREGNAVAITQSLGATFGSGVAPVGAGFFLNNFLSWSDLDPASPNRVAPNRKVENCTSPCLIWGKDRLSAVLGTPGSHGILQTTAQVLLYLEMGLNIQAAIEAPRFRLLDPGKRVPMESRVPKEIRTGLEALGHEIEELPEWTPAVGGFQGIVVHPSSGAYIAGADPRRDGYALGY